MPSDNSKNRGLVSLMTMFTFDKQRLLADLTRISPYLRVLFAAACAERQMPAYRTFLHDGGSEDSNPLIRALDDVWANPSWGDNAELQHQLEVCLKLIPGEEFVAPWSDQASYAQNAGISLANVLSTRISGEAEDAAWAAQHAYDSLDLFVINHEEIDTNAPGGEARVVAHPLVQAELSRQHRDIDELLIVGEAHGQQITSRFQDRAKAEGAIFFIPSS